MAITIGNALALVGIGVGLALALVVTGYLMGRSSRVIEPSMRAHKTRPKQQDDGPYPEYDPWAEAQRSEYRAKYPDTDN